MINVFGQYRAVHYMVEQVTHCVRPAFLFCCTNAKMNVCIGKGIA